MSRRVQPDRRRVARTFVNQAHPMIDEIAGFSRIEIDPRTEWPADPQSRPPIRSRLRSTLAAIVSRR